MSVAWSEDTYKGAIQACRFFRRGFNATTQVQNHEQHPNIMYSKHLIRRGQPHFNPFLNALAEDLSRYGAQASSHVAQNLSETEDGFRLEIALPGLAKEDVSLDVDKNLLKIKTEQTEEQAATYLRRGFNHGSFERSFRLSPKIDTDAISAQMDRGVLTIDLPKKEEAKHKAPRAIAVN